MYAIFFIKIFEEFELENNKSIWIDLLLKLTFKDNIFIGEMSAWSNSKQQYVEFTESFYKELKEFRQIQSHYQNVLKKYIHFLNENITITAFYEKFFKELKNPPINYHFNLINTFGYEKLDEFFRAEFEVIPLLDTNSLQFIPDIISGWYGLDIEVSADSEKTEIFDLQNNRRLLNIDEFFDIWEKRKQLKKG